MSSTISTPLPASVIAGAISSASDNLPEPYFSCASARPATVPGTPTDSAESRDFFGSASPFASRNIVWRRGRRRGFAIVDRGIFARLAEVDHHEAAAADIAGARISHRQRKADRNRRVDRVAAAIQNFNADTRGALLLRHHHAVAGGDRLRRRDERGTRDRRHLRVKRRRRTAARSARLWCDRASGAFCCDPRGGDLGTNDPSKAAEF